MLFAATQEHQANSRSAAGSRRRAPETRLLRYFLRRIVRATAYVIEVSDIRADTVYRRRTIKVPVNQKMANQADIRTSPTELRGAALQAARRMRDWSQTELGENLANLEGRDEPYSQTTVSQWESGKAPIPETLLRLLDKLLPGWRPALATEPSSVEVLEEVMRRLRALSGETDLTQDEARAEIDALLHDETLLVPNYVAPRQLLERLLKEIPPGPTPAYRRLRRAVLSAEEKEIDVVDAFASWGQTHLLDDDPRPILLYAWSGRVIQALIGAGSEERTASTRLLIAEGRVKSAPPHGNLAAFGDGAQIWRALGSTKYEKEMVLDILAADMVRRRAVKRVLVGAQQVILGDNGRCSVVATRGTELLVRLAELGEGQEDAVVVNILAEQAKRSDRQPMRAIDNDPRYDDSVIDSQTVEIELPSDARGSARADLLVQKTEKFDIEPRLLIDEDRAAELVAPDLAELKR